MIERSRTTNAVWLAAAIVAGFTVAACTRGNPAPEISSEVQSITSSSESTTTTAPPTTGIASTTGPTTAAVDDEAAIRELHTAFMVDFFALNSKDASTEERVEFLKTIAIDPQLQRSIEFFGALDERGQYIGGGAYDSHIVGVEIGGDQAVVTDCSQDLGEVHSAASGELLIPADDFYKFRSTEMVKIDGRWWISNFHLGGDEECDPDNYS